MISVLRRLYKGSLLSRIIYWLFQWRNAVFWIIKGKPIPLPHIFKQKVVQEYGREFSLKILIETGTFEGDMVEANKTKFERIYSIELDEALFQMASSRFSDLENITIIQGDSSEALPGLLKEIHEPVLFWLDAHYSGGVTAKGKSWSPILAELKTILSHPVGSHVILIDDARGFIGPEADPKMDALRTIVGELRQDLLFEVKDDIIRIHETGSP